MQPITIPAIAFESRLNLSEDEAVVVAVLVALESGGFPDEGVLVLLLKSACTAGDDHEGGNLVPLRQGVISFAYDKYIDIWILHTSHRSHTA